MARPELVLSSTTSFFLGGIKAAFRNAAKFGFKYLEIVPYRWSRPEQILEWEKIYGVQVAGIHLPEWWSVPFRQVLTNAPNLWEKLFAFIWQIYLGSGSTNPSLSIAEKLSSPTPYTLFHANLIPEISDQIKEFSEKFHILIENLPAHPKLPKTYWDMLTLKKQLESQGIPHGFAFDPAHFKQIHIPQQDLFQVYETIKPEVLHISYPHYSLPHTLPDEKEQKEIRQMLQVHTPRYLVLETNPFVSIKKGKEILEKIMAQI